MICISFNANNFDNSKRVLEKYSFVELRLDDTNLSLNQIKELFSRSNQLIATCHKGTLNDKERLNILQTAIQSGASYVDIDINSSRYFKSSILNYLKNTICKLILSYHNFEKTPSSKELIGIIENMKSIDANFYKIATKINNDDDLIRIFSLYQEYEKDKLIAIGMGENGKISRVVAEFLGSPFTYASIDKESSTAPGQIDYHSLEQIMNLLR